MVGARVFVGDVRSGSVLGGVAGAGALFVRRRTAPDPPRRPDWSNAA